ncbi:MAG: potassium channel protein [Phycisphaerales bacterium]|nr:potassium channel protein [Phycisphaerales bacterium]
MTRSDSSSRDSDAITAVVVPAPPTIWRYLAPVGAFFSVILIGMTGYLLFEPELSTLDAVYMAVITVSTVGFKEVGELSTAGRVWTIVLVLLGVGAFSYFVSSVTQFLVAGELRGLLGRRRMEREIGRMQGHYIVCGLGRTGMQVVRELSREGHAIVVVDNDASAIERARELAVAAVQGDAGDNETLKRAGIDRCVALITALDDDAANVFVVLTARNLNERILIVSRANRDESTSKLTIAGANRVISPYNLAGRRMAQLALRPNVVEFLEFVMHDQELELWLEEITIAIGSALDGATIAETSIRRETGVNVVALRQRSGKLMGVPAPETRLSAGDILVVLGNRENLARLRALANRPSVEN